MRRFTFLAVPFLIIVSLLGALPGVSLSQAGMAQSISPARGTASGADSSVLFIENAGQWPAAARFQVWGGGPTMWLAENAIWLTVVERSNVGTLERFGPEEENAERKNEQRRGVNIKLSFPGANPHPRLEPFDRRETHASYFIGNDPEKWRPDVPVWGGVRYADLYPGVDLVLGAAAEQGRASARSASFAWRLEASASADVGRVMLSVAGADEVGLLADDPGLRVVTALGEHTLALPQAAFPLHVEGIAADDQHTVLSLPAMAADAAPAGNSPEDYPADLIYSTFLGGQGEDEGKGIAVDAAGNAYVTGYTASSDFPTTPGAFDTSPDDGNAFIVKLNATGSALLYATFLNAGGVAVFADAAGNAYVTGGAGSTFPATSGTLDTSWNGGTDAFVAKLNPAGNALVYATFLGGHSDEQGYDIVVDAAGNAYVTGKTKSSDFPTTAGAFDTSYNGGTYGSDAFVAKLNAAGTVLTYATFLGGSKADGGYSIAVDRAGNAYVTGSAASGDFPTTSGAFDTTLGGSSDAFVARLNSTGSELVYATFLGGSQWDSGSGIAVDSAGNTYVTGSTASGDFPTTSGAFDTTLGGSSDAFVARLNSTGSELVYATLLGGSNEETGYDIAVDSAGKAYVMGDTGSTDFPTTAGAFDTSYNGAQRDIFVANLNPDGSRLVYGTFLGGSGVEVDGSIALDSAGNTYVTGLTFSSNFPTTLGAFDTTVSSLADSFVAKLGMQNAPTPTPTLTPSRTPTRTQTPTPTVTPIPYDTYLYLTFGGSLNLVSPGGKNPMWVRSRAWTYTLGNDIVSSQ